MTSKQDILTRFKYNIINYFTIFLFFVFDLLESFALKTQTSFLSFPIVSILFSVLLLPASKSIAAEWWLAPTMRVEAEYNDNLSLTTLPHQSTHGTVISPSLDFGVRSDIWGVSGKAEFVRQSYSDISNEGRDTQNYALSSQYSTERMRWELSGNQSYSTVLVNQAGDPDVGSLQLGKKRKTSDYGPTWAWMMTESTQLQLRYLKSEALYEDGLQFSLFDYNSRTMTASLSHQLSFRSRVFIDLGYSVFKVPANDYESKSTSIKGGVSHSFSDSLRTSLSIGADRTLSEGVVRGCLVPGFDISFDSNFNPIVTPVCLLFASERVSQDDTSFLFSANVEKQFELARMSATLSRSLAPSGSGTIVRTDSLGWQASLPVTHRLTSSLSVDVYDVRSTFGDITGFDRTFYQASPGLRWQLAEEWSFETSFRYSVLKRDNDPSGAKSRSVLLRLIYQGSKISISH